MNTFLKNNTNLIFYSLLSYFLTFITIFIFVKFNSFDLERSFLQYILNEVHDNRGYFKMANNLLNMNFEDIDYRPFGLSIILAGVKLITGLPYPVIMLLINFFCFIFSIYLISIIFNLNTSIWFLILGYEFSIITILGGSEILFILLSLISFYNFKKQNFFFAFFYSSLLIFVRPWGIAISTTYFIYLFMKNKKLFNFHFGIFLVLFIIYIFLSYKFYENKLIFQVYAHDYNISTGLYFLNYPFYSIYYSLSNLNNIEIPLLNSVTIFNIIKILFFVIFSIFSIFILLKNYKKNFSNDLISIISIYTLFYFLLLIHYNSYWVYIEYPRFLLPILPFSIFFIGKYLPNKKFVQLTLIIFSSIFFGISAVGVKRYIEFCLNLF